MKRIIITILIILVLLIVFIVSQLFMRNGLLFKLMAKNERDKYKVMQEELDKNNTLSDNIEEIINDKYSIYYDKNNTDIKDIIINIHGGGLMMGNKEFNKYYNALYADKGYLVFSLEYTLVPEADVYQELNEIARSIDEIYDIANKYNGDNNNIFLTADSAGAFLALTTVVLKNSTEMADYYNVKPTNVNIKGLGLMSGMYYTTLNDNIGIFISNQMYGTFYRFTKIKEFANPKYTAKQNLVPIYMTTTDGDYLKDYTINFYNLLKDNNKEVYLKVFEDENLEHAFQVFHPEYKETINTVELFDEFFKKIK